VVPECPPQIASPLAPCFCWTMQNEIPGVLFSSPRPGYDHGRNAPVSKRAVDEWVEEAALLGIRGVICLLEDEHLRLYEAVPGGLLSYYKANGLTVAHVPAHDGRSPPLCKTQLEQVGLHFANLPRPVVVHCSAGMDRTGLAVERLTRHFGAGDGSSQLEEASDRISGENFARAFRTILIREFLCLNRSHKDWAAASDVDRRSLDRYIASYRQISCAYAWRLTESLGLPFDTVLAAAASLVFSTPKDTRFTWKPTFHQGAHPLVEKFHAEESRDYSRKLCLILAGEVRQSGLSISECARRSGLHRSVLTRLTDPQRQNLNLSAIFEICQTLSIPLDHIARQATADLWQSSVTVSKARQIDWDRKNQIRARFGRAL
jgi:hypothetical protein